MFAVCGSSHQKFVPEIIPQTSLRHNSFPLAKHTHAVLFLLSQSWHQLPSWEPRFLSVEDVVKDPNLGAIGP